jgi:hypothetical protein
VDDGTEVIWVQVFEDAKTADAVIQFVGLTTEHNQSRLAAVLVQH